MAFEVNSDSKKNLKIIHETGARLIPVRDRPGWSEFNQCVRAHKTPIYKYGYIVDYFKGEDIGDNARKLYHSTDVGVVKSLENLREERKKLQEKIKDKPLSDFNIAAVWPPNIIIIDVDGKVGINEIGEIRKEVAEKHGNEIANLFTKDKAFVISGDGWHTAFEINPDDVPVHKKRRGRLLGCGKVDLRGYGQNCYTVLPDSSKEYAPEMGVKYERQGFFKAHKIDIKLLLDYFFEIDEDKKIRESNKPAGECGYVYDNENTKYSKYPAKHLRKHLKYLTKLLKPGDEYDFIGDFARAAANLGGDEVFAKECAKLFETRTLNYGRKTDNAYMQQFYDTQDRRIKKISISGCRKRIINKNKEIDAEIDELKAADKLNGTDSSKLILEKEACKYVTPLTMEEHHPFIALHPYNVGEQVGFVDSNTGKIYKNPTSLNRDYRQFIPAWYKTDCKRLKKKCYVWNLLIDYCVDIDPVWLNTFDPTIAEHGMTEEAIYFDKQEDMYALNLFDFRKITKIGRPSKVGDLCAKFYDFQIDNLTSCDKQADECRRVLYSMIFKYWEKIPYAIHFISKQGFGKSAQGAITCKLISDAYTRPEADMSDITEERFKNTALCTYTDEINEINKLSKKEQNTLKRIYSNPIMECELKGKDKTRGYNGNNIGGGNNKKGYVGLENERRYFVCESRYKKPNEIKKRLFDFYNENKEIINKHIPDLIVKKGVEQMEDFHREIVLLCFNNLSTMKGNMWSRVVNGEVVLKREAIRAKHNSLAGITEDYIIEKYPEIYNIEKFVEKFDVIPKCLFLCFYLLKYKKLCKDEEVDEILQFFGFSNHKTDKIMFKKGDKKDRKVIPFYYNDKYNEETAEKFINVKYGGCLMFHNYLLTGNKIHLASRMINKDEKEKEKKALKDDLTSFYGYILNLKPKNNDKEKESKKEKNNNLFQTIETTYPDGTTVSTNVEEKETSYTDEEFEEIFGETKEEEKDNAPDFVPQDWVNE